MERISRRKFIGVAGLAAGWWFPRAHSLEAAINPVLGLLLFATFLAVPFTQALSLFSGS